MQAGMAATGQALEFAEIKLCLEEFKKHQTTVNSFESHNLLVNFFSFELLKSMDMYRLQVINMLITNNTPSIRRHCITMN